jgi:Flp pilus assembly protein TadD
MRPLETLMQDADTLLQDGRFQEALPLYDEVLRRSPKAWEAANGLAICLHHTGHVGAALGVYSHALNVVPEHSVVWTNFGGTLRFAGHVEWARAAYQRALAADRNLAIALNGMAGSFVNEGDPGPGVEWGRRAVVHDDCPTNHVNLALCLMELGRWDEAWPHYARRKIEKRPYPGDRWRGEEVDWLIVHGEQGLGDEVMFLGCLPQLMDRAHQGVIIEVNPRLVPLVRQSFPQATVIGKPEEFVHPGDGVIAVAALGDLPELCEGGIPPKVSGYFDIFPLPRFSDAVLLAFRGGTMQTHDYLRNPPVEAWRPVVEAVRAAGLRPVSIQYGPDGPEIAKTLGIEHDAVAAGDLTRQAAAIHTAAALISVQQTALHLGGAVGAPVLGVISSKPAWRYGIAGEMPWYETVKLYRQEAAEKDWAPIMGRVADAMRYVWKVAA